MLLRTLHRGGLSWPQSRSPAVRRWFTSGGDGQQLRIEPGVRAALEEGRPVVALESTIISHGMPYPENLAMARGVEAIVRERGAVPATVAVLRGRPHVGLTAPQLEFLAEAGPRARKCSRRDLAVAIAQGVDGATTVAATSYLASLAGVKVFVTGGMGGVHRGAETTFDVSADLAELARTPIVVVCAGVKSILDIEKTLEVLETNGVPVISYGTDDFPAFFSPSSGLPSPLRLDTPSEVANAAKAGFDLGMRNGMIVAVPNPSPMSGGAEIDAAILNALEEADKKGLKGRDITPFVLASVNDATAGQSLKSNVALVRHNAKIGADIAVQLASLGGFHPPPSSPALDGGGGGAGPSPPPRKLSPQATTQTPTPESLRQHRPKPPPSVTVFGGAVADVISKPLAGTALTPGTSTPGETRQSFGGVGRNVAEGVARVLGAGRKKTEVAENNNGGSSSSSSSSSSNDRASVTLVSAVGADEAGKALVASCEECGVSAAGTVEVGSPGQAQGGGAGTASYVAVLGGDGDLAAAVADMRIFERMTPEFVERHAGAVEGATVAVVDGNLPPAGFARVAKLCSQNNTPLVFEPTSVAKCTVPFLNGGAGAIALATPNLDELAAMSAAVSGGRKANGERGRKVRDSGEGLREGHLLATEALKDGKLVDHQPLRPAILRVLHAMLLDAGPEPAALLDGGKHLAVTLGSAGVLLVSARPSPASQPGKAFDVSGTHYPALPLADSRQGGEIEGAIADCTGAGDCLVAGMVGGFALGWSVHESVCLGLLCARQSVSASTAVPDSVGTIINHTSCAYPGSARHVLTLLPKGYEPMTIKFVE